MSVDRLNLSLHLSLFLFIYIYKLIFNSALFEIAFCFLATFFFLFRIFVLFIHRFSPIFKNYCSCHIFFFLPSVYFKFPTISHFSNFTTYFSHFLLLYYYLYRAKSNCKIKTFSYFCRESMIRFLASLSYSVIFIPLDFLLIWLELYSEVLL